MTLDKTTTADTVIVRETTRDTIVATVPDSALFYAWVQCDSLGNVLIAQLHEEQGRRTALEAALNNTPDGHTTIAVRATVAPEPITVRQIQQSANISHTSMASHSVEERKTANPIMTFLRLIGAFALGALTGYITRTFKH